MTDQTAEPVVREWLWDGPRDPDAERLRNEHNVAIRVLRAEVGQWQHALKVSERMVDTAVARCAELAKYARHADDCEDRRTYEIVDGKLVTCTCGLDAALAEKE